LKGCIQINRDFPWEDFNMTDQFFPQFPNDIRRSRVDNDDVDQEIENRNLRRGFRQGRPGKPWYNEPHSSRAMQSGDLNEEGAQFSEWRQSQEQGRRWDRSGRYDDLDRREWDAVEDEAGEVWWAPGPYEGIGPRGYQRSDVNIKEDVCDLLTRHGRIDASEIEIEVKNGEVTLTGMVDDRRSKRLAEDLAESIPGVIDVHNHLRLN
jgi:hypothetical protein